MSKYTTQLRYLMETNYDIGLKDYPIFDENYREVLNKKIKDHYKFQEIGFETAELFKHYLNTTMNEIMPYYNVLYKNQFNLIGMDIFKNYDLTEELTRNADGSSTSESTSQSNGSSKGKNMRRDTPQGNVLDMISKELENQTHASEYSMDSANNENNINDNSLVSSNNTENYVKRIYGNIGVRGFAEDLGMLSKHLMNIDIDVINKLQDLFMLIY